MAASKDRVLSALNFLTDRGITFYPTGIKDSTIQVLTEEYFNVPLEFGSDSSHDAIDHIAGEITDYSLMHLDGIPTQMIVLGLRQIL